NVAGKKRFELASKMLYARRRDMQSQVSSVFRRIFDERLFAMIDVNRPKARLSLAGMTLLSDERLNEEIATNHCSRRLKEQSEYELWGLTTRIVVVTGIDYPKDNQNPVSPQVFAQALMEAIGSLETDASVRLVIFRTFGPVLLDIVPAVYVAANAAFTARGIDVDRGEYFGRPIVRTERQSLPSHGEVAEGAEELNKELTLALTQLMKKSEEIAPARLSATHERGTQIALVASSQTPIADAERTAEPVMHRSLQAIDKRNTNQAVEATAGPRTLHDARQALQEKLTRDEQVVSDIIIVMFDRLLADARMPYPLREIVARLQLPVLELALKDRSLLTQVHHPVRKLLDLIAEFGLTITVGMREEDDSTLRSVASIVDGLVMICNEVPDAFKLAFDRLDMLFYHHEEASLLNDDNLRALERDEAAEFAGDQADREIALRLQNLRLPTAIGAFILTAWRDVLIHGYLKGGQRGDPWKLGLATLDNILMSMRESTPKAQRHRLATGLPHAVTSLLKGAEIIGAQDAPTESVFVALQLVHDLIDANRSGEIVAEPFVAPMVALTTQSDVVSPSAALAALGLACGDWIETRDVTGVRRWRLNWVTSILGSCVFKNFETGATRTMGLDELRQRLSSGEVQRVRGLGLADDVFNSAFETVSRKARREDNIRNIRPPHRTNPATSIIDTEPQLLAMAEPQYRAHVSNATL
ncbi:MAG: DUF1631 domain-containing protein, partial [Burkholderiales bacterium]|nr:DUF1631 domain-containing protein [Burkholderiales bacterium]